MANCEVAAKPRFLCWHSDMSISAAHVGQTDITWHHLGSPLTHIRGKSAAMPSRPPFPTFGPLGPCWIHKTPWKKIKFKKKRRRKKNEGPQKETFDHPRFLPPIRPNLRLLKAPRAPRAKVDPRAPSGEGKRKKAERKGDQSLQP